jgi:hypothetical protein
MSLRDDAVCSHKLQALSHKLKTHDSRLKLVIGDWLLVIRRLTTHDSKTQNPQTLKHTQKMKRFRWFFPLIPIVAIAVFGLVVMLLWNAVIPGITGWTLLTYWKAVGLLILSKILFGGFPGGRGGPPWARRGGMRGKWMERKEELREKWAGMSEEERAKFKERMGHRCGGPRESWEGVQ